MTDHKGQENTESGKFILLGAILGALTGAGAGYLLAQQVEEGEKIQLTPGDGIKIGGSIIAFFRQISTLGK